MTAESKIQNDIQGALRGLYFHAYHPPDIIDKRRSPTPAPYDPTKVPMGQPDIFAIGPKRAALIVEVKKTDTRKTMPQCFTPSVISEGQRNFMDYWTYAKSGFCYLGIGTQYVRPADSYTDKQQSRQILVIPWKLWVTYEIHRYRVLGYHITDIISWDDIYEEFCAYELEVDSRKWYFPTSHVCFDHRDAPPRYAWGSPQHKVSIRKEGGNNGERGSVD